MSFDLDLLGTDPVSAGSPLFTMTLTGSFSPVPEPSALILLGAGLAGLLARRRWARSELA